MGGAARGTPLPGRGRPMDRLAYEGLAPGSYLRIYPYYCGLEGLHSPLHLLLLLHLLICM